MPHSTWKAFYAAQIDNELSNKNTSVYTEAWSPDKNDNERFQNLISDPDNVLLATDLDNMIHTLHSFQGSRRHFSSSNIQANVPSRIRIIRDSSSRRQTKHPKPMQPSHPNDQ